MEHERLSLNTITVRSLSFEQVVEHATRRQIRAIAPWRNLFEALPVQRARSMADDAGLSVSSLCRGGMFTAETAKGRAAAVQDNLKAVDEAAALGAHALVLVCGPVVGKDPAGSLSMIVDGVGEVLPYAAAEGVPLALEPLHPMMAAGRSALCTLQQARWVVDQLDAHPGLGVCVDAYHLWWDAQLKAALTAMSGRVLGYHVSDWVTPINGELSSRGMMGDGCIDLPDLSAAVRGTGYRGFVEVEILSDWWWSRRADEVIDQLVRRFSSAV